MALGSKRGVGERQAQQFGRRRREFCFRRAQAAAELVLRSAAKRSSIGEVLETRLEGGGVIRAGALVEQRRRHRREPALARRVERGAAGEGKADRHYRQRMVLDQPGLDAGGAGHPLDRHRAGIRRPADRQQQRDRNLRIVRRSRGAAPASSTPVAELRSTRTARAAASTSAGVTAPMRVRPGVDVVQALADRQRRADDVGRPRQAVAANRSRRPACAPWRARPRPAPPRPARAGAARHRPRLRGRRSRPPASASRRRRRSSDRSRSGE